MSNNGPSFTKATYDAQRVSRYVPSPDRRKAELDQAARDCEDRQLMATDPSGWLAKHRLVKDR